MAQSTMDAISGKHKVKFLGITKILNTETTNPYAYIFEVYKDYEYGIPLSIIDAICFVLDSEITVNKKKKIMCITFDYPKIAVQVSYQEPRRNQEILYRHYGQQTEDGDFTISMVSNKVQMSVINKNIYSSRRDSIINIIRIKSKIIAEMPGVIVEGVEHLLQ